MFSVCIRLLIFSILTVYTTTGQLNAQVTHSPLNMALGGGGTAYTTGYESVFINPANLYIQEKDYSIQVATAMFGTRFSSPIKYSENENYLKGYFTQTDLFNSQDTVPLFETERESFISRNYQNTHTESQHISSGEIHLFGIHWAGLDRSYAISLRSRYSNRYEVGRNYYDPLPLRIENRETYDRTLDHQFQSLYELSFGYAESFTFLNGLFPQLSQVIIGVAPKLIASGAYFDARYDNRITQQDDSSVYRHTRSYQQHSTGLFSEYARQYTVNPERAIASFPSNSRNDLFTVTGFGLGMDLGVTYLITLGDDLSVVRENKTTITQKSLRVSLAVTDVGFVTYHDHPGAYSFDERNVDIRNYDEPTSDIIFTGQPGEQFNFLGQHESHPIHDTQERDTENFSVLLPTSLHAGVLFQIRRIKLTGDFSLGLTNNAFTTTRFITFLGAEVRVLPNIPIRAGTRIGHRLPGYYSFGGGVESRYFDFNLAFQLRSKSAGPTNELSGASVAAIKFYIP